MTNIKKWTLGIALALVSSVSSAGAEPVEPVNQNRDGLAVKGYDVVAYFNDGEPTEGSPELEHRWRGATWRFATEDNLASFRADPESYAPQYGGYCAWAVSKGKTASISPKAWSIVDGKLYLNHRFAQGSFKRNTAEAIAKADENWPAITKKPLR